MGSDESQFNVSLIVRDKVTRQWPQTTTFLKRKENRSGIEPRPFSLPAGWLFTAGSNRLTLSVMLVPIFVSHKRGTRNYAHLKGIPRTATRAIIGMELQNNYDTHCSFSVDVWAHLLKIDIWKSREKKNARGRCPFMSSRGKYFMCINTERPTTGKTETRMTASVLKQESNT